MITLLLRQTFLHFERLGDRLTFRVCEDQLDLLLYLFEFLVAEAGETDSFFEKLQRFVERDLLTFQTLNDLLEVLERLLELVRFRA